MTWTKYHIYVHRDICTYIQILDVLEAVQIKNILIYKYMSLYSNYTYTLKFCANTQNHGSDILVASSVILYSWGYGMLVFFGTCAIIVTYLV